MTKKGIKRTILVFVAVTLIVCALALSACGNKKHTVIFENGENSIKQEVADGATVEKPENPTKDGYTFLHWAKKGETEAYDFSTPVKEDVTLVPQWKQNETPDDPDEPGKPDQPAETETVRIRWITDDCATFVFDGTTPRNVKKGDTVKFRISVSPYYEGTPVVKAGEATATLDKDGYYSFVAEKSVDVEVTGLKIDKSPMKGLGTVKNPYVISSPAQWKQFADGVNDGNEKYTEANFVLESDLDMKGVTVAPVGMVDSTNGSYKYFQGTFDGKGHTVKNFKVDASYGAIGLFGYLTTGTVRNLNVETDITVETAKKQNYIIGGIVGYTISGDIINCKYTGTINVIDSINESECYIYVGGICGFVQGYSTEYTGTISFCEVNGSIKSTGSKTVYTAGGIAGATYGASDAAPAYIHSSVFNGTVEGKIVRSGGIVGYMRDRSSVANCYSTGTVSAQYVDGYATAGGIVGESNNDTVIVNCYSTAAISARGQATEHTRDNLLGLKFVDGYTGTDIYTGIDSRTAMAVNSYYSADGIVGVGNKTYNLNDPQSVKTLLNWSDADWKVVNKKLVPDYSGYENVSFTITFDFGTNITLPDKDGNPLTQSKDPLVSNGYGPLYWAYEGSGMNNFKADDGTISYGYFLDEAHTKRLPAATVLTSDTTVYVGFADYSKIEGEYYTVISGNEITLTFDDNGKMTMSSGAMVASYVYVYDGANLLIREGYFAYLYEQYKEFGKTMDLTADYYAQVTSDGGLKIYDTLFFTDTNQRTLKANKRNAAMGLWYDVDNTEWTFYSDLTGKVSNGNEFTYTCNGDNVQIIVGGSVYYAVVEGTKMSGGVELSISRYDEFVGKWESSFNTYRTVAFNGKGYDSKGQATLDGTTYDYVISGDTLLFDEYKAYFSESGLLVLEKGEEKTVMGKEGSFIGTWTETALNYSFRLDGITKDGYGTGLDSNGVAFTYAAEWLTGTYTDKETGEAVEKDYLSISVYYRTTLYGLFDLATRDVEGGEYGTRTEEMLFAAVYTASSGFIVDDYNMAYLDPYEGDWNGENGQTLTFNGLGAYDINSQWSGGVWVVKGEVEIKGNDRTQPETVGYYYYKDTRKATFTYKGTKYVCDLGEGEITVNGTTYRRPDAIGDYFYQEDGVKVEFNGMSNVGCGKASVTVGDGTLIYDYDLTVEGTTYTATIRDGETAIYTLVIDDESIVLNGGTFTNKQLGIGHRLVGETFVTASGYEIKVVGYLDRDGFGKGKFGDTDVTVTYTDETYLAIYYEGTFMYYWGYLDDNASVLLDGSFSVVTVITTPDGMAGTYTAEDGSTLTLDGRSNGGDYVYAGAEYTVTEDEETITYPYIYKCEDGRYFVYELDRSGDEDALYLTYEIKLEPTEGAKKFTAEDGREIYLVEIVEEE